MGKLLVIFFILGMAAIGGLFFYTNYNRPSLPQNNASPTTAQPTIIQLEVCKEFSKITEDVGCEDAVKLAEGKYDATTQSVTQGSKFRKKGDTSSLGKDVWIIDILLNKPVSKNQQVVTKATVFLDRKTGEELSIRYAN